MRDSTPDCGARWCSPQLRVGEAYHRPTPTHAIVVLRLRMQSLAYAYAYNPPVVGLYSHKIKRSYIFCCCFALRAKCFIMQCLKQLVNEDTKRLHAFPAKEEEENTKRKIKQESVSAVSILACCVLPLLSSKCITLSTKNRYAYAPWQLKVLMQLRVEGKKMIL